MESIDCILAVQPDNELIPVVIHTTMWEVVDEVPCSARPAYLKGPW
jgi:hypothetical protein